MNSVKIKRDELLKKIKKNRDTHAIEYREAYAGYKTAVIEALKKMLDDIVANKAVKTSVNLPVPQDHTEEYDTVIAMLEMSVDKVIELDNRDFNRYVLDNWEWKALNKTIFESYATAKY